MCDPLYERYPQEHVKKLKEERLRSIPWNTPSQSDSRVLSSRLDNKKDKKDH